MPALLYICGREACDSSARKSLSSLFFLFFKPTIISLFAYHCIVCSYPLLAPFACRTHTQIETLTRTAIRRRAICDPTYVSAILLLPPNDVEAKGPLLYLGRISMIVHISRRWHDDRMPPSDRCRHDKLAGLSNAKLRRRDDGRGPRETETERF